MSKTQDVKLRRVAAKQELPAPWRLDGTTAVSGATGKHYRVWAQGAASNLGIADELGEVLAKKADLEKRERALKEQLRRLGLDTAYEGVLFRATVGLATEVDQIDGAAMRDKLLLEGYHAFVKAHTQTVPKAATVRVVSRTGKKVGKRRAA